MVSTTSVAVTPAGDLTRQLEADDARDEHGDGLAEHGRLGLDATNAPAEHADAVDHRGVRVGADAGVRVGLHHAVVELLREHDPGEVLDVDLVDDAGARRDDLEVVEGLLAPPQELVPLAVALVLDLDVALDGVGLTEDVDDDGVINDQLGRRQRIDLRRIAAEVLHGLAHGGQVHHAWHAGEVLHHHASGRELDLRARLGVRVPVRQGLDVLGRDVRAVLGAKQVLEQHLQAVRQLLLAGHRVQPEDLVTFVADGQCVARPETVNGHAAPLIIEMPS
jgi:hypothetical protein